MGEEGVIRRTDNRSKMESILLFIVVWAWAGAAWFGVKVFFPCVRRLTASRRLVVVWRVVWSGMVGAGKRQVRPADKVCYYATLSMKISNKDILPSFVTHWYL